MSQCHSTLSLLPPSFSLIAGPRGCRGMHVGLFERGGVNSGGFVSLWGCALCHQDDDSTAKSAPSNALPLYCNRPS